MRELSPSDRMHVIGLGQLLHPGSCMVCGSGNSQDGYLSFGVFYDYEGHQYLCMDCALEAAETIRCLTPEETSHLMAQCESLATENAELMSKLEAANERLKAYDTLFGSVVNSGVGNDAVIGDSADKGDAVTSENADKGESESKEPAEKPGPNDATLLKSRNSTTGNNGSPSIKI